ncbi:MAG: hypothetical protein ACOYOD_10575 [Saprospiraceae bacterium]
MRLFATFTLFLLYLNAYGQVGPTRNWVDSKAKYVDSNGNPVEFMNSSPKGGGVSYYGGKKYSYVVFWTRIRNLSASPIELKLKFPDLISFNPTESSQIKIVLPKDSMTFEKIQLFDYGLTHLESLLNNKSNQVITLQKRINPQEERYFYFPVFMYNNKWPVRATLILKGQDLYYKIALGSDTTWVPCGRLIFYE